MESPPAVGADLRRAVVVLLVLVGREGPCEAESPLDRVVEAGRGDEVRCCCSWRCDLRKAEAAAAAAPARVILFEDANSPKLLLPLPLLLAVIDDEPTAPRRVCLRARGFGEGTAATALAWAWAGAEAKRLLLVGPAAPEMERFLDRARAILSGEGAGAPAPRRSNVDARGEAGSWAGREGSRP